MLIGIIPTYNDEHRNKKQRLENPIKDFGE